MFEKIMEVLTEFGQSISYRFINKMKLINQQRNKTNADLEVKYQYLDELYEQELEYVKKINDKKLQKKQLEFKVELEKIRHEIAMLKIEIRDLERNNKKEENEKEFQSLSNYQRWEEDIRHRRELERIEQEATREENHLKENSWAIKRKAQIRKLRQDLSHEINMLKEQIAREEKEYKIAEMDQKKRNELELQAKEEESRHQLAILEEEIRFLKSRNALTEEEQKRVNELEECKIKEEMRHKVLLLGLEVQKKALENEISEQEQIILIEKLKGLLTSKKVDTETEIEQLRHENAKKIEELKFLKEKNRITEEQLILLHRLELEQIILDYSHEINTIKESNNFKKEMYTIEEEKQRSENILSLLKSRDFDFSSGDQVIKELLNHKDDDLYVRVLYKNIDPTLYKDVEFMSKSIKINGILLDFAAAELKKDKTFVKNVLEHNPDIFNYVDFELQNDIQFVLELLRNIDDKFEFLNKCNYGVKTNSQVLDYVLDCDSKCIKFIVPDYEKGAEKIVELLTKDNSYISYVSFDIAKAFNLGENKEFVRICLKGNYFEFKPLIADKFRGDKELAADVIGLDNKSVIWFNDNVLNDEKIMLDLINSNCYNIVYIGNKLLSNEEFIKNVVNENGLYSERIFAEKLLKIKGTYLKLFSEEIKNDKKLVLIALRNAGNQIKDHIGQSLLLDEDIIKALKLTDVKYINKQRLFKQIELNGLNGWKYELANGNSYVGDFDILMRLVSKINDDLELTELFMILNNKENNIIKYLETDTKKFVDDAIAKKIQNQEYLVMIGLKESENTKKPNRFFDILKLAIETDNISLLETYTGPKMRFYDRVSGKNKDNDVRLLGFDSSGHASYEWFRIDIEKAMLIKEFVRNYGVEKIMNYLIDDYDIFKYIMEHLDNKYADDYKLEESSNKVKGK